jgi:hypothetical protein
VTPELDPGSDFAYLGGPPPDHFAGPFWVWKPATGHATGTVLNSPLDAEARSAALDGQAQTAQFYSGVAFGVAASAFIAAVAVREQGATRTGRGLEANWTSETPPALVAEPPSPGELQASQSVDADAGHGSPDGGQTSRGAPTP